MEIIHLKEQNLECIKRLLFSGSSRVGVLKTDAKGDSNVLSLQAGTYFVKEIKAPKGYALNPRRKQ